MAAKNAENHSDKQPDNLPKYGDGASLYLYAISDQTIISLRPEWKPPQHATPSSDTYLELPDAFLIDLHDYLNKRDENEKDNHRG